MKVNINSNGLYSIKDIDAETLNTVMYLLGNIKDRCFDKYKNYDESNNRYYSGEGFIAVLEHEELEKFQIFVRDFWIEYENMKSRMSLKLKK